MTDIELLHLITAPTRYQIITLLLDYHYCVKALAAKLGISEPAVSQQMNVLKECGLVTGERLDYQMHYTVNRNYCKGRSMLWGICSRQRQKSKTTLKIATANLPQPAIEEGR